MTEIIINSNYINFSALHLNIIPLNCNKNEVSKKEVKFPSDRQQYVGKHGILYTKPISSIKNTYLQCGDIPQSIYKIVVIDLDGRHIEGTSKKTPISNEDLISVLQNLRNMDLIPFMVRVSGNHGYHIFICMDNENEVKSGTNKLIENTYTTIDGIDVRADGSGLVYYDCKFTDTDNYRTENCADKVYVNSSKKMLQFIDIVKNDKYIPSLVSTHKTKDKKPFVIIDFKKSNFISSITKDPRLQVIEKMYPYVYSTIIGEIKIPHAAWYCDGVEEFEVWKACLRCMLKVGMDLDEILSIFSQTQAEEFEYATFAKQAGIIINQKNKHFYDEETQEWKWISRDLYFKIYPLDVFKPLKKEKKDIIKQTNNITQRKDFFISEEQLNNLRKQYTDELLLSYDLYDRTAFLAGCGFGKSYQLLSLAQTHPKTQFIVAIPNHRITEGENNAEKILNDNDISNFHIKGRSTVIVAERNEHLCILMSGEKPFLKLHTTFPSCTVNVVPRYEVYLRRKYEINFLFKINPLTNRMQMICKYSGRCPYKKQFGVARVSQVVIVSNQMYNIFFHGLKEYEPIGFDERTMIFDESFETETLGHYGLSEKIWEYHEDNTNIVNRRDVNHDYDVELDLTKGCQVYSEEDVENLGVYNSQSLKFKHFVESLRKDVKTGDRTIFAIKAPRKEIQSDEVVIETTEPIETKKKWYWQLFGYKEHLMPSMQKIILNDGTCNEHIARKLLNDGEEGVSVNVVQVLEFNSFNIPQEIIRHNCYKNGGTVIEKNWTKIMNDIAPLKSEKVLCVTKKKFAPKIKELYPLWDVIWYNYSKGTNEMAYKHDYVVIISRFGFQRLERIKYQKIGYTIDEINQFELNIMMQGIQRERLLHWRTIDVVVVAYTDNRLFPYISAKMYKTLV